jgi:lysyl-tRNA synthetase class 2
VEKQEEILDPTQYFENRSKMINELKKDPNTYPYPHKFHVAMTVSEFTKKYDPLCVKGQWLEEEVSLAGRVTTIRRQGKSLIFIDLKQEGQRIQVMCNSNNHKGIKTFDEVHATIRRGDIIGIIGFPGRTNTEELSIAPGELKLLSPCLRMLPDPHTGFKDRESRYRKRYLDLIMNNRTRETFITRSKVLGYVRNYLTKLNFVEVETPMMNMIPGGATARPFMTHHNDLDMKLYMRIAPELFLKQLVVGGLERVFEIGKNFRNESIDQTHNPEYTACEFYMAYADYHDLIHITEDMLSSMVKELTGSFVIKYHPDPDNNPT